MATNKVHEAVVVNVGRNHSPCFPEVIADAGTFADVGKSSVAVVVKKPTGHWFVQPRNAVAGAVAGRTGQILGFVKVDEAADKQIEAAVVVIVEPNRARRPSWRGHTGFLGHIGESAVAIVVIQNALAILRDV